jgi:hypothetical protein
MLEGRLDLDLEDRMFLTSTAVGLVGGHARGSPTFRELEAGQTVGLGWYSGSCMACSSCV